MSTNQTKQINQENEGVKVKFKLLFINQKKADGTSFTKMMTILSDNTWVAVRFGDEVNTKIFKNENQLITAYASDVRLPLSNEPYVGKDGKKHYPYVWCERIIGAEKYVFKGKLEPKETTPASFSLDDEETMPFENEK